MKKILNNALYIYALILFSDQIIIAQCIDSTFINQENSDAACYLDIDQEPGAYKPVCGCNGITYMSPECAYFNGVKNWQDGPCDCYEPKWKIPYRTNFYQPGQFLGLIPRRQVCGCDSVTYLNSTSAYFSGVTTWTNGVCSCVDSSVIDLNFDLDICSALNFTYNQAFVEMLFLKGCDGKYYKNMCEAFYRHGITKFVIDDDCNNLPQSQWDPDYVCPDVFNPVCGCNGVTYKNECIATKHFGILDFYQGECDCTNKDIISKSILCTYTSQLQQFDPVCACNDKTYLNECKAVNENGLYITKYEPCSCIDTSFINQNINCSHEQIFPWCGCDGNVYKNYCEAIFHNGVMGKRECACIEPKLINMEKNCNEIFHYDPVCGCDGRTYPNECFATYKAGITKYNSIQKGPCPGTCKDSILTVPGFPCSDVFEPVCGCDNITYQNECEARYKYGLIKWKKGACTSRSNDISSDIKLSFYPNPTTDNITITCPTEIVFNQYECLDINGKLLKTSFEIIKNNESIDLSWLSKSGIYFLKLKSAKNTVILKVILVK